MPDYLVLISTFGGISVAGLNGFVHRPDGCSDVIVVWDIFTAERGASGRRAKQAVSHAEEDASSQDDDPKY